MNDIQVSKKTTQELLSFEQTNAFSTFFLDYINQKESLKGFYNLTPELENFEKQITEKKFSEQKRKKLHKVLSEQYKNIPNPPQKLIDSLLLPNTFTVTTGHQLNIFSGPLYFHYKIITVIKLAEKLKKKYPKYNFVALYWMASEDHDYEEISVFNLFGKQFNWQTEQRGAVGRFSNQGLDKIIEEIGEDCEPFKRAYTNYETLADATRFYTDEFYKGNDLLILDADDKILKNQLKNVIKSELLEHKANDLVEQTSKRLKEKGYKTQIYPRKINLFYLKDGIRERIVRHQDDFVVLNTQLKFSKDQILALAENKPELFSPNVVLRPLYQEIILPNLSYTGGPAEMVYWLQLKSTFEYFDVPFPILLPRNFALYINKNTNKKKEKLELSTEDLFKEIHILKKEYVQKNAVNSIVLDTEIENMQLIYEQIKVKVKNIDNSLAGFLIGEEKKTIKSLEKIAQRLKKSEERKHETALKQIEALKNKLLPGGSLQERKDNILNFYINDKEFLMTMFMHLEPFDFRFHVISSCP